MFILGPELYFNQGKGWEATVDVPPNQEHHQCIEAFSIANRDEQSLDRFFDCFCQLFLVVLLRDFNESIQDDSQPLAQGIPSNRHQ